MKQYLGHLMIIGGGVQNDLFKIAAKQCLRLLILRTLDDKGGGKGAERFI